jgi:hypothetical protein
MVDKRNLEIELNNFINLRKEVDMGCGWEDEPLVFNDSNFRDAVIVVICLFGGFLLLVFSWMVKVLTK